MSKQYYVYYLDLTVWTIFFAIMNQLAEISGCKWAMLAPHLAGKADGVSRTTNTERPYECGTLDNNGATWPTLTVCFNKIDT